MTSAKFGTWARTNSYVASKLGAGQPPTILYVADNRTHKTITRDPSHVGVQLADTAAIIRVHHKHGHIPIELTGVRSGKRAALPTSGLTGVTKGLTVATPNPLYVKGNYNCPGQCPPQHHQHHPDTSRPRLSPTR